MWSPGTDTRSKAGKENTKKSIVYMWCFLRRNKKTKKSKENVIVVVFVACFKVIVSASF